MFASTCRRLLATQLLLRLLVAVRDKAVQEATWPALIMVSCLCLFDVAVQVAGSLIIGLLVIIELG